jgi:hypothetical protein
MRGHVDLRGREAQSVRKIGRVLQHCALLCVVGAAPIMMDGCAGITSASNANTTTPPPPTTLAITNVQAASPTTTTAQIVWTTNVAANSQVDYGTSTSYGSTTPVDSTMVTNHQITLSGLAAGTTYYYQVSSTDSKSNNGRSGGHGFKTAGFGISGTISPAATAGNGATVALSGPASMTTTADSSGNYTFSGLPNGAFTVAPSHPGYTFTPTSLSTTVNGSNVTGVNFTASASTAAPTITAQPVNQTVAAGQTASFTVVATGTAPLSYQWQKSGANIAGATSASYTTPATTTSDNGATFGVVVSNTAGTVTSAVATLTVNAAAVAPNITAQPVSQTVTAGQTAGFSVSATGTAPLSYQWQKNGVNIAGANAVSYVTPATTTSDNGATFRVVVSNSAGTTTSAAATLAVNGAAVAPTITAQPVNQTVTAGQTASFGAVATGTAPLSYQWQKSGVNIAGAISATYTTPATTTSDNGATFRVVVSNTAGTVTSAAATLTVNAAAVAPTITGQPVGQTVTAGQTAGFSVSATGTAPLSYQWQKNGVTIAGATSATYTTPATTPSDNGATFVVVVSNTAGSATSTPATLTVNAAVVAPTITAQPAGQTVTAGQTASFSATANGTAPLTYQWQKSGVNIAGATSASYTTPATTTSDNGATFRVVVSNTAGTVTSAAATLTVTAVAVAPTITAQPASQTVTAGQTASFLVAATGTAPLSYQWQKNGANITGATSASYTTPVTTTSDNGATFAAVVSNTAGSVTSAAAVLTVNAAVVAPSITAQPVNQTVTAGQTATFSVTATGTAPLSYQWQKSGVNIAGATSATYTTPVTAISDNGATFATVVSNTAGSVTSAAATLTVNAVPAPAIQVTPTSMAFANTVVGASLSQPLLIKNTGTATLTISQLTATGSGFSVSGFSLPLNVGAGQQVSVTVVFVAPAVGPAPGNISIVSNAATSPTSVGLSGTGIAATFTLGISPTSLSFGNVTTGTSSAAQNVVITDTGNSSVAISQITLSGAGYSMTGGSAPVTLTPSQSVTLSVQLSPTAAGPANGNISIVSNANGSPAAVTLTGTGVAPHWVALTWNASTSSVTGYNIYRSTVSGGPYAKISSLVSALSYNDSTVQNGTTYYYVITAVDSQGTESVFSNQTTAVIP